MNYRLGAFGWLGGPKFQEQGGIPNVGLHDQKAALEWVQEYITQFGGDPDREVAIYMPPYATSTRIAN